jgi:hypothetical protein
MRPSRPIGTRARSATATLWILAIAAAACLSACGPSDERPGTRLPGVAAEEHVDDWTFTDDIDEIFIETQTWYRIPHVTTIWCVSSGGALYIGSYGEGHKYWEKNVAHNAEARVSIDGVIHEVRVDPVSDPTAVAFLDEALNRKYDMAAVFGDEDPPWWFYRVTQR